MAVTLGYRYFATDNVSFKSKTGGSVNTGGTDIQNAELGFRFNF
jgi:opacity protein-like surface antigen